VTCSSSCRRVKLRTPKVRHHERQLRGELPEREVLGPGEERGLRPLGANWKAEVQSRQGGGRPPGARGADAVNRHGVILSAGPPEGSPRFTSRSPALAHGAPPGRDPRPGRRPSMNSRTRSGPGSPGRLPSSSVTASPRSRTTPPSLHPRPALPRPRDQEPPRLECPRDGPPLPRLHQHRPQLGEDRRPHARTVGVAVQPVPPVRRPPTSFARPPSS